MMLPAILSVCVLLCLVILAARENGESLLLNLAAVVAAIGALCAVILLGASRSVVR